MGGDEDFKWGFDNEGDGEKTDRSNSETTNGGDEVSEELEDQQSNSENNTENRDDDELQETNEGFDDSDKNNNPGHSSSTTVVVDEHDKTDSTDEPDNEESEVVEEESDNSGSREQVTHADTTPSGDNWACPVPGCADVYDTVLAATEHVYFAMGDGHGENRSVPTWPVPSDEDPRSESVGDGVLLRMLSEFNNGQQVYRQIQQLDDFNTPSVLTDRDLRNFDYLRVAGPIREDSQLLVEWMEYIEETFDLVLQQGFDSDVEGPIGGTDDNFGGAGSSMSYSEEEVEDSKISAVKQLVSRLNLKGHDKIATEVFTFVYSRRPDRISVDDAFDYIHNQTTYQENKPALEDYMTNLYEAGLLDRDSSGLFYYPKT